MSYLYISGPLTLGDKEENIKKAIEAADQVLAYGGIPYIPHLNELWDVISHKDYDTWLDYDLQWVAKCDALIRIPGESPGGDVEVEFAKANEIPVFYSVWDWWNWEVSEEVPEM